MLILREELREFVEALRARPDVDLVYGEIGGADAAPNELHRLAALAPQLAEFYEVINGLNIRWRFNEMPEWSGAIYVRCLEELFAFREEDEEHQFGADKVAFSFDLQEYDDSEKWTWFVRDRNTGWSHLVYADGHHGPDSAYELAKAIPEYLRLAMHHGGVAYWQACFRDTRLDYGHAEHAVRRFQAGPARSSVDVGQRVTVELSSVGQGRGVVLALHRAGEDHRGFPVNYVKVALDEGTCGWIPRARVKGHFEQDAYETIRDPAFDVGEYLDDDLDGLLSQLARCLTHGGGLLGCDEGLLFTSNASQAAGLLSLRHLDDAYALVIDLFEVVWELGPARHERRRVDVAEAAFLVTPACSSYSPSSLVSALWGALAIRAAHACSERRVAPSVLVRPATMGRLRAAERVLRAEYQIQRAKVRPPMEPGPDLRLVWFLLMNDPVISPSFIQHLTQQPHWNEKAGLPAAERIYT